MPLMTTYAQAQTVCTSCSSLAHGTPGSVEYAALEHAQFV